MLVVIIACQKGGQSSPSTVHDRPCFLDDRINLPVINMDVHSNIPIYGGGSYLDANTKFISNYFPHQHTNNCDADILQPTKREKKMIYEFSKHFQSQDTWKCQPQTIESEAAS
ncbi:unnamed protein product [Lathyrus sativus]|nr:unnamed protein product [Lathyrus sativus]